MEQPDWQDPTAGGAMVRGALWLVQVIGEGSTFTKTQLREAFPGVAQADRRIRDLRDYGWVVYSSAEDVTLSRDEQRFISAGVPVWNAKARRENAPTKRISARERQAILQRDGYMCTLCGIMGGEPYPDDPVMTGVLSVSARPAGREEDNEPQLVTECKRCRAGGGPTSTSIDAVVALVRDLDGRDLRRLIRWVERGRRGTSDLDRAWAACRSLPNQKLPEVAAHLHQLAESQ